MAQRSIYPHQVLTKYVVILTHKVKVSQQHVSLVSIQFSLNALLILSVNMIVMQCKMYCATNVLNTQARGV